MGHASTAQRTAAALTVVVAVLLVAAGVRFALYEPNPAVWHEASVERGLQADRDIDVTIERGWTADLGGRIVGDLWVKYGGTLRIEFRCADGTWLGVGLRTERQGTAVVPNPDGACP